MGGMNIEIEGTMTYLEIFEGPIGQLHRTLAGFRPMLGGDGKYAPQFETVPAPAASR